MYRLTLGRQALGMGLLVTLVILTLNACGDGGGGGNQQQAKEQAKIRGCVPECVDGLAAPGRLVGSYTTQYFFDGHLTVKFDKPWESQEDQAVEFSVAPLGKWDVHRVIFWSDIYPVEPDDDQELQRAKGMPITTAGWLRWLETNPNLRVSEPRSVTIGEDDIPAKVVDISVSGEAVNTDPECPDPPCQEILSWPNSDAHYGFSGSWTLRLYLADISYGGKTYWRWRSKDKTRMTSRPSHMRRRAGDQQRPSPRQARMSAPLGQYFKVVDRAIHRSAWNKNSANFAFAAFSEVQRIFSLVTFGVTFRRQSLCRVAL